MIHISVDDKFVDNVKESCLFDCIKNTIAVQQMDYSNIELSILITSDENLKYLNTKYRGINETTDVLSFQADTINQSDNHLILGDIVVSFERASLQASIHQHSVMRELQLLIVHGLLHLVGYDHVNKSEKERMWKLQRQILSSCKL